MHRPKTEQAERLQIVVEDNKRRLNGTLIQSHYISASFYIFFIVRMGEFWCLCLVGGGFLVFLVFSILKNDLVENSKEETGEMEVLTNPLLTFAAVAAGKAAVSPFDAMVPSAYAGAKTSATESPELIKPLGKGEYNTTGG